MSALPPRRRFGSSPDVEVLPESAYQLLKGLQTSVDKLDTKVEAQKSDTDLKIAGLTQAVAKVVANDRTHIAKIMGIVAGAVVSLAGVVVAARPAPVPAQVTAVRSQADLDLDECRPLQPGSYERAECFERVSRGPSKH